MKTFVKIILLIFLPYCYCSTCDKICGKNQIYSRKVSQCQNTCWNRKFNETSSCLTSPGCVCKNGHLRHPDSYECIAIDLCPVQANHAQCGDNEVYSICASKTIDCENTCDTKDRKPSKCACKSGCRCKSGFTRSSVTFQCIPNSKCETCPTGYKYNSNTKKCSAFCLDSCPKNQTFTECGSKCREPKCPMSESSSICTQECTAGCYCDQKNGYKRDVITNKCVLSKDCSRCPDNEIIKCGNPLCERTCETIYEKCTEKKKTCQYKCYCEDKYVRAFENSQCVSENQCPVINNKDVAYNSPSP